jgi:hypothetical protein
LIFDDQLQTEKIILKYKEFSAYELKGRGSSEKPHP